MSSYAPLWCKSNFSFLEGASHPDELVEETQRLGLSCLALTDRDGVYGIVRGHVKAQELGIHLIIGSQVSVDDGSTIYPPFTRQRWLCESLSAFDRRAVAIGKRRKAK